MQVAHRLAYPVPPMRRKAWGLGDVNPQAFINAANYGAGVANQTGSAVAGAVAGGLSATGAILSMTPAIAAACPPCGAAVAIGAQLVGIIAKMAQGCGQSCIAASDAANQAEPLLVQNVNNYVTAPVRTRILQAQALANFDAIFGALVQKCQQIGGQGGTNCVKDRVEGACKWKASPWTWTKNADGSYTYTPAGPNGSGNQCWNWVYGYRQSIAADPGVVDDAVISGSTAANLLNLPPTIGGADTNTLLLLAAIGIGVLLVI